MAFHICTLTFHASVELVKERVVDHSKNGDLVVDKSDRNTNMRESMNEIGCSIFCHGVMICSCNDGLCYSPIGSTHHVGSSVRGCLEPAA